MLCRKSSIKANTGSVPVHLNVYDLTPINAYAYWLGLGVYHSGVQDLCIIKLTPTDSLSETHVKIIQTSRIFQLTMTHLMIMCSVHGAEYAFGAHEYPTTGIFEGEPKQCQDFSFRKTILIGWTEMGPMEVRRVMEGFADAYRGNAYNLITKNCNHFCNDACLRLTGNPIPSWVNRLARIGFICHCIVPVSINNNKVGNHRIDAEKNKLNSNSNRFSHSSTSSSSSSSSPQRGSSRRCDGGGPHSSPWVPDPPPMT